jgi:lipoprotein NlpD
MKQSLRSLGQGLTTALVALVIAGCASSRSPAPVETRAPTPRGVTTAPAPSVSAADPALVASPASGAALPGAENAGKPGYYTVRAGDTMIRIGLEHGQNWRDVARWNNLVDPNRIEVGQVLRVIPPEASPAVVAKPVAPNAVEARPIEPRAAAPSASAPPSPQTATTQPVAPSAPPAVSPAPATSAAATPAAAPTPATRPAAPATRDADEDIVWTWPADGALGGSFDETRNKGVAILGKAGDPVVAAADGRVVYAGSGLRGYGNLVIVKHNNTYLSAYAHNQTLLVKEDQAVRRGQKIAEMGSSDADRVQLHFEIRRQGRPVDPTKLLPPR